MKEVHFSHATGLLIVQPTEVYLNSTDSQLLGNILSMNIYEGLAYQLT